MEKSSSKYAPKNRNRWKSDCHYSGCFYFGEIDQYGLCPECRKNALKIVNLQDYTYSEVGEWGVGYPNHGS